MIPHYGFDLPRDTRVSAIHTLLKRYAIVVTAALQFVALTPAMASGKVIDLRRQTDSDGVVREISYCARPSPDSAMKLPGHAFVTFATVDASGRTKFRSVGHTTFNVGAALLSYTGLLKADGAVVSEIYTSSKQRCLTTLVNRPAFDAVYQQAMNPLAALGFSAEVPYALSYTLGAEDCLGFMIRVAKRFQADGMKLPARGAVELPLDYLRRMIDAN